MLFNICVMSSKVVINESVRSVCFCTDFRMQRDEYKVKSRPQKLVWELLMRPGMCCRFIKYSLECQWEPKKNSHRSYMPQCSGAQESNCCSSVSFASCGVSISGKAGLVGLKMTPQPNIFFFRVKKKLSLSTCAPIQRRAWIKLLQLREFCAFRAHLFRKRCVVTALKKGYSRKNF